MYLIFLKEKNEKNNDSFIVFFFIFKLFYVVRNIIENRENKKDFLLFLDCRFGFVFYSESTKKNFP